MGLLIVTRQPNNRIGWLYSWMGLLGGLQLFLENYAVISLLAGYGSLPFGIFSAWIASWIWVPAAAPALLLLPLFFPDGRLMSERWRPFAWLDCLMLVTLGFVVAFNAGPLTNFTYRDNPFGLVNITSTGEAVYNTLVYYAVQLMILPLILVSVASVFMRLNKSTGIQRQQLKWFAYAGVGLFIGALGGFVGPVFGGIYYVIGPLLLITAMLLIPVLTGMAILRYRLWDIDLLIRKTLQYTLLTGLLLTIYLVTVILLQNMVIWIWGENSEAVIVISTLIIAALFTPVRIRVQDFINRRFYRSKYNAESILAEFAAATRSEMDIDRLSRIILNITDTTIQPSQVTLWLKK